MQTFDCNVWRITADTLVAVHYLSSEEAGLVLRSASGLQPRTPRSPAEAAGLGAALSWNGSPLGPPAMDWSSNALAAASGQHTPSSSLARTQSALDSYMRRTTAMAGAGGAGDTPHGGLARASLAVGEDVVLLEDGGSTAGGEAAPVDGGSSRAQRAAGLAAVMHAARPGPAAALSLPGAMAGARRGWRDPGGGPLRTPMVTSGGLGPVTEERVPAPDGVTVRTGVRVGHCCAQWIPRGSGGRGTALGTRPGSPAALSARTHAWA